MRWPHGRATVDPTNPQLWGTCDRCGVLYNYVQLSWQYEYRGLALQNIKLLVCPTCLDVPFPFNQPIIVPPDPEPIQNPRPAFWQQEENQNSYQPIDLLLSTEENDPLETENNELISGN